MVSCAELSYAGHVCDEMRSKYVVSSLNTELPELLQYEYRRRYHKVKLNTSYCANRRHLTCAYLCTSSDSNDVQNVSNCS
jgi:hypothetical protein